MQTYSAAGGVEDVLLALSEDDDLACFRRLAMAKPHTAPVMVLP
jgi:hypothetical protein